MIKENLVDWDPETGRVHTPPQQFFVELTGRCNLACVHCPKDYGAPDVPNDEDLDDAVIDGLLPWLERARFVNLNIVGEPLMAPALERVVRHLAGRGPEVAFNTNGVLLTPARAEFFVEQGVHSIAISCDGLDMNRRVRGIPFETIRDRLVTLDAAKRRLGATKPHLALAYTLMSGNLHEFPRVLRELLPLVDVHAVHVQPLVVFYETLRGENVYEVEAVDEVVAHARELCAAHGTELALFRSQFSNDERTQAVTDMIRELGPYSETLGCTDPFFELKVRADGQVDACSFGRSPEVNLHDTSIEEVWNGEWYRRLRLDLAAKRFEGTCTTCPFLHGCALNQLAPLREGVRHSRHEQFLGRR